MTALNSENACVGTGDACRAGLCVDAALIRVTPVSVKLTRLATNQHYPKVAFEPYAASQRFCSVRRARRHYPHSLFMLSALVASVM